MNISQFIDEQLKERYKNFIIYGPINNEKTKIAKNIAKKMNGEYFSLIEIFRTDISLKSEIDTFDPIKLNNFIKRELVKDKKLIIIDEIDFLINTWNDYEFSEFMKYVERTEENVCCIFILENHRLLRKFNFENDKGKKRIINIYDIK